MDAFILIVVMAAFLPLSCKLLDIATNRMREDLRMTNLEQELEGLPDEHPDKLHSHLTSGKERREWALKIKTKRMNEATK